MSTRFGLTFFASRSISPNVFIPISKTTCLVFFILKNLMARQFDCFDLHVMTNHYYEIQNLRCELSFLLMLSCR